MSTKKTESRRRNRTKIGIVGCGAIGRTLAKVIDREFRDRAVVVALADRIEGRAQQLARALSPRPTVEAIPNLVRQSDLVIESAHASVVGALLKQVIAKRKNFFVMSSGGLWGHETLLQKARRAGIRVIVPSGALFGIDGVKAAATLPLKKITLTTRKPPRSFEGAPFVLRNRIRLGAIRREKVLFRGNLQDAIKAFPQNINVAATLGLAGADPRKFEVKIIADPSVKRNSHEVILEGPAGKLVSRAENVPSKENPKTSRLAILSAVAALKAFFDPVRIGT